MQLDGDFESMVGADTVEKSDATSIEAAKLPCLAAGNKAHGGVGIVETEGRSMGIEQRSPAAFFVQEAADGSVEVGMSDGKPAREPPLGRVGEPFLTIRDRKDNLGAGRREGRGKR